MDVNHNNYEEHILDYLEGSLPNETSEKMKSFLEENPSLFEEVKDLHKYILPSEEIRYKEKQNLYRTPRKISLFPWGISGIAASIALLLGYFLFNNNDGSEQQASQPVKEEITTPELPTAENKTEERIEEVQTKKVVTPIKKPTNTVRQTAQKEVRQEIQTDYLEEEKSVPKAIERPVGQPMVATNKPIEKIQKVVTNSLDSEDDPVVVQQEPRLPKPTFEEKSTLTAVETNEQTVEEEPEQTKQSLVDSITEGITFAENEDNSENATQNGSFEVETIPSEEETFVVQSDGFEIEQLVPEKGDKDKRILLKPDKKVLKKALVPKSFGLNKKKNKEEDDKTKKIQSIHKNNKFKEKKDE